MAVTLIKRPWNIYPAFNPNRYIFDSNNKTLSAFRYVVQVYEGNTLTNKILDLRVKPRFSDGFCEIDLAKLLQSKVKTLTPFDNYPNLSNNFYGYSVRVGEEYISATSYVNPLTNNSGFVQINVINTLTSGQQVLIKQVDLGVANPLLEGVFNVISSTPTSFVISCSFSAITNVNIDGSFSVAGAPKTVVTNLLPITGMISVNANISSDKIESYVDNFYRIGTLNGQIWTSLKPQTIYRHRESTNYVLAYYNWIAPFSHRWEIVDSFGNTFRTVVTSNQSSQIQLNDMSNFTNVIGGAPFDITTAVSWELYAIDSTTNNRISKKYFFEYDGSCPIEDIALCFLDRYGSWLTIPFIGRRYNYFDYQKQKGNFQKPLKNTGSTNTEYADFDRGEKVLESIETRKGRIYSGWLYPSEFELIRDLIGSKQVYLKQIGNLSNTYQAINITEGTTEVQNIRNKKLFQKEINFEFANKDSVNG